MIKKNAYFNGAEPFKRETEKLVLKSDVDLQFDERADGIYLICNMPEEFSSFYGSICSSACLDRVRIVDAEYENPDGTPVILDRDYLGNPKKEKGAVGPLQALTGGKNCIKVWDYT